jgi:hypothetical protein
MVYFELKYYSNSQHSSTTLNGFNSKRAFSLAIAPLRLQNQRPTRSTPSKRVPALQEFSKKGIEKEQAE